MKFSFFNMKAPRVVTKSEVDSDLKAKIGSGKEKFSCPGSDGPMLPVLGLS